MDDSSGLHRDLGRMEGKLDAVLSEIRAAQRTQASTLENHGERLTALEEIETERKGTLKALKWAWGGIAALIGFFVSWVSSYLGLGR